VWTIVNHYWPALLNLPTAPPRSMSCSPGFRKDRKLQRPVAQIHKGTTDHKDTSAYRFYHTCDTWWNIMARYGTFWHFTSNVVVFLSAIALVIPFLPEGNLTGLECLPVMLPMVPVFLRLPAVGRAYHRHFAMGIVKWTSRKGPQSVYSIFSNGWWIIMNDDEW
jgi:hypothetical protein